MSITLDGTSGINNDATNLNYTGTLTGGTGVINIGSGQFYKDASGNVGIGVTPSAWSQGRGFEVGNAGSSLWPNAAGDVYFTSNAYFNAGWKYGGSNKASAYQQQSGAHYWFSTNTSGTAGNAISFTQAMTLDSSGNLLVGTTSSSYSARIVSDGGGAVITMASYRSGTGYQGHIDFRNPNGVVGYIGTNGTTTNYTTSSDYRLKHDIQPMTGALAKVALLKPCTYKWNADDSEGEGFIAHELQEVCPSAVTGEKDAVDADGNPVYQGIDTSFLVATLTAAIQEQQQLITALTARVEALEAQNV